MAKSVAIHATSALTPEELLIQGFQIPTGTVNSFAGVTAPSGWLLCDGTSYVRTDYQELFNTISTAHGAADGTHFNVPDLRGKFVRGVDGGSGNDPDAASRTAAAAGGNTGNNVGSIQDDAFESHTHVQQNNTAGGGTFLVGSSQTGSGAQANGVTQATGGNETRPKNVYMTYIIKY